MDFGAANLRDNGVTFGSVALPAKSRFRGFARNDNFIL